MVGGVLPDHQLRQRGRAAAAAWAPGDAGGGRRRCWRWPPGRADERAQHGDGGHQRVEEEPGKTTMHSGFASRLEAALGGRPTQNRTFYDFYHQ